MKKLLLFTSLLLCSVCSAQVRIDWQQSYGSLDNDYAFNIIEAEDGFLVLGRVNTDINAGLFDCNAMYRANWLIKIDNGQQLVRQDCFSVGLFSHLLKGTDDLYYMVELGDNGSMIWNLRIKQLDEEANMLWNRSFGTSYGLANVANNTFGVTSSDGGVVVATEFLGAEGDISQEFGEKDCWVVKIGAEGNMVWETTLGTESDDFVFGLQNANDGGYYVGLTSEQQGDGNIGCGQPANDGVIVKLDADGQVQWSRCYPQIQICNVIELENGFLLAGECQLVVDTLSNCGDGIYSYDCCLLKCDAEGNIEWRKDYGGSCSDRMVKVFCSNGGYTVFANSKSSDGDVANAANLGVMDDEKGNIWVFHVGSDGDLIWERCIGSDLGLLESVKDVIKVGENEYVLLGESEWFESVSSGDVNCSNNVILPESKNNIWVLQITDTFDYDEITETSKEKVFVHPSPTTGFVRIEGKMASAVQVFNALGQLVKTVQNTNEVTLEGMPQGVYLLRVTLEDGKVFSEKVVQE